MPSGALSSCAIRSKRGSVTSKRSRRRRRTSPSIRVVQVRSRSHRRSSSRWSSGISTALVSASRGIGVVAHRQISPPATAMACPVTERAPSPHSQSTASATLRGSISRPCGLCFTSSASASSRVRPVFAHDAIEALGDEIGVGKARADGIDGDAGLGRLERQRAHEADDRVLGGAIGAHIGIALQARGRGHGDDAAEAALGHGAQHRLRRVDDAHQVDVEHLPEEVRALIS